MAFLVGRPFEAALQIKQVPLQGKQGVLDYAVGVFVIGLDSQFEGVVQRMAQPVACEPDLLVPEQVDSQQVAQGVVFQGHAVGCAVLRVLGSQGLDGLPAHPLLLVSAQLEAVILAHLIILIVREERNYQSANSPLLQPLKRRLFKSQQAKFSVWSWLSFITRQGCLNQPSQGSLQRFSEATKQTTINHSIFDIQHLCKRSPLACHYACINNTKPGSYNVAQAEHQQQARHAKAQQNHHSGAQHLASRLVIVVVGLDFRAERAGSRSVRAVAARVVGEGEAQVEDEVQCYDSQHPEVGHVEPLLRRLLQHLPILVQISHFLQPFEIHL